MRVQLVVFDGVEELDVFAPYEVLAAAAMLEIPVQASLVALDAPRTVTARYGTTMSIAGPLAPAEADVVIAPGGGYGNRAPQGTWAEIQRGDLPAALAAATRPGLVHAAVCSGTMLLTAAGLTQDRPCTTHRMARDDLIASGSRWIDARVVDDGDLVTSGGVTSGLDLALWLVERYHGPGPALAVENYLEYERRGTVWRLEDLRAVST